MTEEFLQYIWKYRLYKPGLSLVSGEPVEVVHPGEQNFDEGPDFFNTRIRLGQTIWAGNAEVHIRASDWQRHDHDVETNYGNVVLHVVYENDYQVIRANGEIIPAMELRDHFDMAMYERYRGFMQNKQWIPCEGLLGSVSAFVKETWLERLLIERLERKEEAITIALTQNHNDWHETFYRSLARAFGFKLNADAFELLAKSLPQQCLGKHKDNLIQVEALLFGQAGLLGEELTGQYAQTLWHEYKYLRKKFELKPISGHLWRFMRLRPSNFPTVRIAQFAMLVHESSGLFSQLLEIGDTAKLLQLLDTNCSDYWNTHYHFGKDSAPKYKHLGEASAISLVINTLVPFMFALGRQRDDQPMKDKALQLLQDLPGEVNSITKHWTSLGMDNKSAANSQSLIELKNNYCDFKKCLNCSIGNALIRKS